MQLRNEMVALKERYLIVREGVDETLSYMRC